MIQSFTEEQKRQFKQLVEETPLTIKQIADEMGLAHNTLNVRRAASNLEIRRIVVERKETPSEERQIPS